MIKYTPILFLFGCASMQAQAPMKKERPKLIVGVVVDQMRADMIARYWDGFGEGGFKRLVRGGTHAINCHLSYTPAFTSPGHASIYTGTTPSVHGIMGNWPYVREHNAHVYSVDDNTMRPIGREGAPGRSPKNLLSTTLADELELFSQGRSKTIGIALKDRSAILPIGRMGDAAYWFYNGEGDWITSSWYTEDLPQWVKAFNAADHAERYMQSTWDLLLDEERYVRSQPDESIYELSLLGGLPATLPIDLAKATSDGLSVQSIVYTPFGNSLTTDMAIAALDGEGLGLDEDTDLLAISYSSTDEIGHEVGIRAREMEDTYYRLDRDLERLLIALDERLGEDYVLFLTADHGAVDVPAFLRSKRGSADVVDREKIKEELIRALSSKFGEGAWVSSISTNDVYLDLELISKSGSGQEVVERYAAEVMRSQPGVAEVMIRTDLMQQEYIGGVKAAMQKGFMAQRSGDLRYSMLPSHLPKIKGMEAAGTEHGSNYNYDGHIPLLFYGNGIPATTIARRVWVEDIIPTISLWSGVALPDGSTGDPIHEVFKE